jgi:hypothetical protein
VNPDTRVAAAAVVAVDTQIRFPLVVEVVEEYVLFNLP